LCYVYDPLDADVVEFDINPDDNNDQWYGVQASLDHNPLKGTVNAVAIGNYSILKKIDTNDLSDFVILDRIELNEKNTMVYFALHIQEDRSVPISVSSDWVLIIGKERFRLARIHGLPADKDYIRDAGFTTNTFRAEFPAVKKKFKKGVLRGTVCGEKVQFELRSAAWHKKRSASVVVR
jgi:hypothetical protein